MKYYGKIQDGKDLITKEYADGQIEALDYTSPSASTTTSTTFIDTVSQTNGKISATKKTLPSASTSAKGIVQLSSSTTSTSTTLAATASAVKSVNDAAEKSANKVTSISASSTNTQYPSAKCVYDLVGNVEALLAQV